MPPLAGIIAAGTGSRLAKSHPGVVKPLLPVAGRPLCHWVVEGLRATGCREVTVLTNGRGTGVPPSLKGSFLDISFDFLLADTASSFESFRLVALRLASKTDAFMISTVDALIPPLEVSRFWNCCSASGAEAGLALTGHVDDENPLWVDVDASEQATAVGADSADRRLVTCGLYYLTRRAAQRLPAAADHGRLRDFWTALVRSGARVQGVTLSKTLDVDRPEDLAAAETFLATRADR
ncbi:MAG: NTP transferase domain-containing protein [Elusimicrobiota bacterium]